MLYETCKSRKIQNLTFAFVYLTTTIVDLVSTGKTIKENNLKETDILLRITSKLIINKIAYKLMNDNITSILDKFKKIING